MADTTVPEPPASGDKPGSQDSFAVHRQMVLTLFAATIVLCAILGVGLKLSKYTVLVVVVAAGALGGFVSALRRVYSFQRLFPAGFLAHVRSVDVYLIIYSMIPSLVGSIAAVALYLLFASKLIEGDIFPKFHLGSGKPQTSPFVNFVWNWEPKMETDYAKALIWAFVAGFSERFVPDILERFATSQQTPQPEAVPEAHARPSQQTPQPQAGPEAHARPSQQTPQPQAGPEAHAGPGQPAARDESL